MDLTARGYNWEVFIMSQSANLTHPYGSFPTGDYDATS